MHLARRTLWFCALAVGLVASGCGGSSPGDDDDDGPNPPSNCTGGLGEWTGHDNVMASFDPPCGLQPKQAPLFVALGWDDNPDAAGVEFAMKVVEDRGGHTTFYVTSTYASSEATVAAWRKAKEHGHEIGNHTVLHEHGGMFTADRWRTEIGGCNDFLTMGAGAIMTPAEIYGFRTPFLEYNDATLATVAALGFQYDCSIEEGYEDGQDGTNFYWPYTLDNRSPGHTAQVAWGEGKVEIEPHPGLWEMPTYAVFTPPDDKCEEYGIPSGFRARLKAKVDWFDPAGGSITGFDYNLWAVASAGGFEMTKAEFLATLKYSLDLRAQGNRAPFLLGIHSAYYLDSWSTNAPGAPNAADRQAAIAEFLDYAKEKYDARIASYKEVLDWVRNPQPI